MRYVLLHHHIFKNAGTTLDSALEDQFGSSFATLHDSGEDAIVTQAMMSRFLQENLSVIAISSHHFFGRDYVCHKDDPIRFISLVLIRDPVDRLRSIYNFYRINPDNSPVSYLAFNLEVRHFIDALIENHPNFVDNAQVNMLANYGFYARPVAVYDLELAWDRIKRFAICAPTERYESAMVAAEHFISPNLHPHRLNLASARQNVMQDGLSQVEFREALGNRYEFILEMNQFDRTLHKLASTELDRRLALVPCLENKTLAFRKRCLAKEN